MGTTKKAREEFYVSTSNGHYWEKEFPSIAAAERFVQEQFGHYPKIESLQIRSCVSRKIVKTVKR